MLRMMLYILSYLPWGAAIALSAFKTPVENLWVVDAATFAVFMIWFFTELGADTKSKEKLPYVNTVLGVSALFDLGLRACMKLTGLWYALSTALLFLLALSAGCFLISKMRKNVHSASGKFAYFSGARILCSIVAFVVIGVIASFVNYSEYAVCSCVCVCVAFILQALFYHTNVKGIVGHNCWLFFAADVVAVVAFTAFILMQYDLAMLLFVGLTYTVLVPKFISPVTDKI